MAAPNKDSRVLSWGHAKVVEVLGADLRSLAAFRIVLALLVLADLANRATDLSAHYTDAGVLPRTALIEEVLDPSKFSLHLMNGQLLFQALLFGAAALAALGMLVGYRTRMMNIIVWALLLSIHWRNPLVLGAGDILLHLLLFWGMLLPLGAYWSVDRKLKAAHSRLSMQFLSFATVGLFMQIALMYWFTAIMKSGDEWRVDGTAIYYALSIDQIATPIGTYLYEFPELLRVMTFGTLALEILGPFLLFSPFFTGPVRTAAIAAFMSLHLGIWLTMNIGIFPWISAFCMVCFLPGWFWDKAAEKLRTAFPRQPQFLLGLRRAATQLSQAYWPPLRARLAPAAQVGEPSSANALSLSDEKQMEAYAAAPVDGSSRRGKTKGATGVIKQQSPRGGVERSGPSMLRSYLATDLFAALCLFFIFCWNLTTVSSLTLPERISSVGLFLGLDQSWGMFAPYPSKEDGWYVIPGNLRGGQQVDVMPITRGDFDLHAVSWEKPPSVAATYKNEHWRKYLERIWDKDYSEQRLYFGQYICREWNARHTGSEQLMDFQITYMLEQTLPDYQRSAPEKVMLWEHSCF
jgi:hypothetical protein